MTLASPESGKSRFVNADSILEHLGKERFAKNKFSLAAVSSRHRRFCIQKLSTSGQPGTEWASPSIPMTLVKALRSRLFTN